MREARIEEVGEWLRGLPPRPEPPMDPDTITDIIIENCFHLAEARGMLVLYGYSEKTLRYLERIGYEVSKKENHVLYMKGASG